jgi:WD40 repeat protein
VAYSADGRKFVSIGGTELLTWDAEKPDKELTRYSLTGGGDGFTALALPANGTTALLGGTAFGTGPQVFLWDLKGNIRLASFPPVAASITDIRFSPDGTKVLATDSGSITYLWDFASRKEVRRLEGAFACFSPDGGTIFSGKGDYLLVWDANTYQEVHYPLPAAVYCLACGPDRRQLFLGLSDNSIRLWDTESRRELRAFTGHTQVPICLAVSADGRRLLSGAGDRTVRLWDVAGGKQVHCFEGHLNGVSSVAISPSGRRAVSASADGTLRLWALPE